MPGSFRLLGTHRISSLVSPASEAGDDAVNDVDDDEVRVVEDEDEETPASPSSWSPPSDLADLWLTLVGLSSPDSWEESRRLGPPVNNLLRRWSAADSGFRPFRRDPCLHAAFEKLSKESKSFLDFCFSAMQASCASAHAVSHASAYIDEFVRSLSAILPEARWTAFCEDAERAIKLDVLTPLHDASRGLAHIFGRSVTTIRSGVVRHADSAVQPVLKSSPPSSGFFFGDPSAQVTSSLNLAVMSSLVSRQRPSSSRGGYFRRPAASTRGATSATSTTASSSSATATKGKGKGRSSRGRGGGQK